MHQVLTRLLILILFVVCFFLSGCQGQGREVDETAFALALGIDLAEDDKLEVSYQLGKISQTGQDSEKPINQSEVITIKASATAESRNLFNSIIAQSPNMSHAKVVVVSEKIARRGLKDVIAPITRFREYRGSMFVIVVRGTAKDFLKANSPRFTTNPAKYYEAMMKSSTETEFYPKIQLHELYLAMKDKSAQPYVTYAAVNPLTGEGIGDNPVPGSKEQGYIAGSIPRSGGNNLDFAGTAVFRGDKMVGILNTQETRALGLLIGHFKPLFLTVEDPTDPQRSVMVLVGLMNKPKITASLKDGYPAFTVNLNLEGEIGAIATTTNYEKGQYRALLEEQISNVYTENISNLLRKTQELNSDVVGFGYHLRPLFTTIDEFFNYEWNNKYKIADIKVHVKTTIRRHGLMQKTVPIADEPKE